MAPSKHRTTEVAVVALELNRVLKLERPISVGIA